jgi:hypothetical protein
MCNERLKATSHDGKSTKAKTRKGNHTMKNRNIQFKATAPRYKCSRRRAFILTPLIFACLAVTSTLTMAAGDQTFTGTVSGTIPGQSQWGHPNGGCVVTIPLQNSGDSNLLGQFTGTAIFMPNMCDNSYTGTYNFVATNGHDSISGFFRGQLIPTATAGLFYNLETATIAGGTGRFKHASGQYTLYGFIDFNTSTFVAPWLGILSPDGH